MKRLLPMLAIVGAATCLMLTPTSAMAGSEVRQVCNDPSAPPWQLGFDQRGDAPFNLAAACPDLKMEIWDVSGEGQQTTDSLLVGTNLTNLSVTISGGPASDSGLEVSLRVCSFAECGRLLTPGDSGLPSDEELSLADGIPADPVTVLIKAECTRVGGCDVQPDTVFTDLTLTFADDTPPVVELANSNGTAFSYPETLALSPGQQGQVGDYVYVNVSDGGSLATSMWWTFDDGPEHNGSCSLTPDGEVPVDCGYFDGGHGMIMPPAFEGLQLLTVYVQDQAGNIGSARVLITRDSVAPEAPENLTVGANDAGWINQHEFTAHWTNPDQPGGLETDPGVTRANYTIEDSGGDVVSEGSVDGAAINSLSLLVSFPGEYTLTVSVVDAAGNQSDPSSVDFKFDGVVPVPPNIASIPVVNAGYVGTGLTIDWADPTYTEPTFSEVCSYRTAINSLAHYEPTSGAGVTTFPVTTKSIAISPGALAAMSDGVRYLHVAATSCAGRNGQAADAALVIDRQPPRVAPEPTTGGWLAPGTPLVLRADDSDPNNAYAGVSAVTYSIDDGPDHVVSGPKASIALTQGMRTIKYQAEDIAGNKSEEGTVQAGIDSQAPGAAFGATDPADPALISASVTDVDSGVGDAWIEFRSPGSPVWARLVGTSDGGSPRTLKARFPDDDSLPNGEYDLRIVARDRAGNTGSTTSRVDGSTASVTLPLRRHPLITLAVAPGQKAATSNSLAVPFGAVVIARGTLRDSEGAPLAGASIALSDVISGGQRKQFKLATTDGAGAFSAFVPIGPSRALFASFRGDALRGSATASATFSVRASVTLKKLPKTVRSGNRLYLRGKVDPGTVALPRGGARVQIQHRSGSRWSGLVVQARTASDGTFEIPWSQKTHGRAVRMRFRASVDTEAGWPYAQGYSTVRKVVIR